MRAKRGYSSVRTVAVAFASGAAAGAFASRLLPPVLAMGVGSARAAAGRDPFAALIADHQNFSVLLRRMEDTADNQVARRMQLLLRLKRGLAAHALAEEDVVYPLLHDEAKAEQDAKHLYGEHADIKVYLYRLEEIPKHDPRWPEQAHALRELVEKHALQEEEVEFPKLREVLGRAGTARLSRNLSREKSLIL